MAEWTVDDVCDWVAADLRAPAAAVSCSAPTPAPRQHLSQAELCIGTCPVSLDDGAVPRVVACACPRAAQRAFRDHEVNGSVLLGLDAGDLRGWGLSDAHVKRICVGLDLLRETTEEMSTQGACTP